jgi:hypothetical protein
MVYLKFEIFSKSLRSNLLTIVINSGMGLKMYVVSTMFAIPSNFKFKYFFNGHIIIDSLAPNESICCNASKFNNMNNVVTLALGSQPRQGLSRVWANSEAQESHFMLPKCGRV